VIKWYEGVKLADWIDFSALKRTFNSADHVGNDRYVFDIKGNRYRVVAMIIFKVRTVFILFVGTHKEFDRINAKQIKFRKDKS
jgi:mRNA interferase HigB